ncbi:MAG: cob(I)yrinic acid a,c-diamide adenosyltransferase [Victivallales bacterium]|nr:cob(I)yrinic acid a,c-diamide adenosyltransferase [Victivallales bacterium]
MRGFVHVYTGNGKGKTTSVLGMAVRASGHNKKVFIGQFMKGMEYGENLYFKKDKNILIKQFGWDKCIRKDEVNDTHRKITGAGLRECKKIIQSDKYDIVILDEVIVSVWFGLVTEEMVLDIINTKPERLELILTGRYATENIIKGADLVTEMKSLKHYYDRNIKSRVGIEY